jgi:hypothetical protein
MRSVTGLPPIRLAIICICAGALLAAPARPAASVAGVDLAVPGRASATASIAADDRTIAVAWGASLPSGATDVYLATSADGGRSFGPPIRVNDIDGDARLNGEQPPRVAMRQHDVTVVWTTKGAAGTKLVQARSIDGGRTFARASAVPGGDAVGNRGWENATADRGGRVYAVWLDHREMADAAMATSHHEHHAEGKADGVAMAQKSKLYIAALDGAVAPRAVTGGVCYCCKTAIAAGADGAIYTAWRHVYPGNVRDIAFSLSRDGGRTFAAPIRVSEDKWVLEGCPDDGPAMAVDAANRVHVVWPTLITDDQPSQSSPAAAHATDGGPTIALFYATSSDGKSFTARRRIPTRGMPHHPQIAIGASGAPVIAWDEAERGGRTAAMSRVTSDPTGAPRFAREVLGDAAVYPIVAVAGSATIAAWTSGKGAASVIHVEVRP